MRTRAQVHKKSQKITKAIEKLAGRKGSSEQKRVREVAERRGTSEKLWLRDWVAQSLID